MMKIINNIITETDITKCYKLKRPNVNLNYQRNFNSHATVTSKTKQTTDNNNEIYE